MTEPGREHAKKVIGPETEAPPAFVTPDEKRSFLERKLEELRERRNEIDQLCSGHTMVEVSKREVEKKFRQFLVKFGGVLEVLTYAFKSGDIEEERYRKMVMGAYAEMAPTSTSYASFIRRSRFT